MFKLKTLHFNERMLISTDTGHQLRLLKKTEKFSSLMFYLKNLHFNERMLISTDMHRHQFSI